MNLEEKNALIDALAYSLKNDKMSEAQYEYKRDRLFCMLLQYKGLKIEKIPEPVEEDSEELQFEIPIGMRTDEDCEKTFTLYNPYDEEVMIEHIEEAFLSSWNDYLNEDECFKSTGGSYIHIFNIHLKVNCLDYYKDKAKEERGNFIYAQKRSLIKYELQNIMQDLGVKDFEMPTNVMNYDVVKKLLCEHGADEQNIHRMLEIFEWDIRATDIDDDENNGDNSGDKSVFDEASLREYHSEKIEDREIAIKNMVKIIRKAVRSIGLKGAPGRYLKCYLGLRIAKYMDAEMKPELEKLGDALDWNFIKKYQANDDANEIQFVADYLGIENGTAQKGLRDIELRLQEKK